MPLRLLLQEGAVRDERDTRTGREEWEEREEETSGDLFSGRRGAAPFLFFPRCELLATEICKTKGKRSRNICTRLRVCVCVICVCVATGKNRSRMRNKRTCRNYKRELIVTGGGDVCVSLRETI